jgi:hypothetical protein
MKNDLDVVLAKMLDALVRLAAAIRQHRWGSLELANALGDADAAIKEAKERLTGT